MVFKGTPGPWFLQSDRSGYYWLGPKDCDPMSAVIGDGSSWGKYAQGIDVDGPDAHLIAASPELLEALQSALEWIDAVPDDTPLPTMPGINRDWIDGVISKALGV